MSDLAHLLRRLNDEKGLSAARFLEASLSDSFSAADSRKVAFYLLGVGGEVGELLNVFKKAARGEALGRPIPDWNRRLRGEFGDAIAYLTLAAAAANVNLDIALAEQILRNYVRYPTPTTVIAGAAPLTVVLLGPACSGKSGLVSGLPGDWHRYVEDFRASADALKMIRGEPFDAFELQAHFIDSLGVWLQSQDAKDDLVIDQHPAVIGRVYSEIWFERGLLTERQYLEVLTRSVNTASGMARRPGRHLVVHLDADSSTLRERHLHRDGSAPELSWFDRIRDLSLELTDAFDSEVEYVDTTSLDRPQVQAEVLRLIRTLDSS